MKKLYLLACLSLLLAPVSLLAYPEESDRRGKGHQHTGAPEMPHTGVALAAAVGIAGYLVLRRRHATQN